MDFLELAKTLEFSILRANVSLLKHPHPYPWEQYPNWVVSELVNGEACVELQTGEKHFRKSGSVIFIPPNCVHRNKVQKNADNLIRWSHVNFRILHSINISEFLTVPFFFDDKKLANEIGNINEKLSGLLARLTTSKDLLAAGQLQQNGFELLCKLIKIGTFNSGHPLFSEQAQRIYPALQYIEKNLSKTIDREQLSAVCSLSAPRFHVLFTKYMKTTPMKFVRMRRCEVAQELLASTELPVAKIAQLVGYDDQYIFSRAFKMVTNNSPSAIREYYRSL